MSPRRKLLVMTCLALGGLPGCTPVRQLMLNSGGELGQLARESEESERRAAEMQKDCDTLKTRTITFEEESAFGGAVSVNWVSQGGGLTSRPRAQALHVQLNKIGRNLAAQSSRPNLPWTFGVLQSEGVNAVSGPAGYVFVSEGLLARLDNEAQLAGVLAHEISHITRKHAMREYQRYLVEQCEDSVKAEKSKPLSTRAAQGAQELDRAVKGTVQELGQLMPVGELRTLFKQTAEQVSIDKWSKEAIQAFTNGFIARISEKGFGEEDEYEADLEAVELMAAAGYSPEEYVGFLSKLPDKGLSTEHPRKEKRQGRLNAHLAELRKQAEGTDFTTSVDLSQTTVIPLRDALRTRRATTTPPTR